MKENGMTFSKFYSENKNFVWGPFSTIAVVYLINNIPVIRHYLVRNQMVSLGVFDAGLYVLFSLVLSYSVHGFILTHASEKQKIQKSKRYEVSPTEAAIRSSAAIMTNLVYCVFCFRPSATSWTTFLLWDLFLSVYWDLHFFVAHKLVHEHKKWYAFFHKRHHTNKQPNCFSAYYVEYQSHIILEQIVILLFSYIGLPRSVLLFNLYRGTLGTFLEHAGYDLSDNTIPFTNINLGHVLTVLNISTIFLEGESPAEHDYHHEKFHKNYSLSFKYLDKLFGSYHPGHSDPIQPRAKYHELKNATETDCKIQSRAFDEYKKNGFVLENVLDLVRKLKGVNGDIGAAVDMYEHSLQTATRARRAGEDSEFVCCCLLHDIGEIISFSNHGEVPASILRPYISPLRHNMLYYHEIFQAYYFLDKCGGDKDLRDKVSELNEKGIVQGSHAYEEIARFCEFYDQKSFDPTYESDELDSFKPELKEILVRPPFFWDMDKNDCKSKLLSGYGTQ